MRKLKHLQILGSHVAEALEEFNERREELRIAEADVVNVDVLHSTGRKIGTPKRTDKIEVLIFYWSEE
jgi:hypothetical protein